MPALLADDRPQAHRQQETILVSLTLAVLSGIALVHVLFAPVLGAPPARFFVVLLLGFGAQVLLLIWLQGSAALHERAVRRWTHLSIWTNLAFAFALSLLAAQPDSHYVVLTVLPVVAAAFRYRVWALAGVVFAAGAITLVEVALLPHPAGTDANEYFEAASVLLMYVVVATVVAALAGQLRKERAALEKAHERLLREERLAAVGRLASALAHEIRNPVAMITSSLALGRSGGATTLAPGELDLIVTQEAARLERLTADFLTFARPAAPRCELGTADTALGYVAELARARAAERRVSIEVKDADGALHRPASFDPFLVHQALLNLTLNAIDAAPAGSVVLLRAALADEGTLSLAVENAGPAIGDADCRRIFEPFFTTKPTGTGLGLAIARNIARAHGGDTVLESNRDGAVRFALHLPLGRAAAMLAAGPPAEARDGAHPSR